MRSSGNPRDDFAKSISILSKIEVRNSIYIVQLQKKSEPTCQTKSDHHWFCYELCTKSHLEGDLIFSEWQGYYQSQKHHYSSPTHSNKSICTVSSRFPKVFFYVHTLLPFFAKSVPNSCISVSSPYDDVFQSTLGFKKKYEIRICTALLRINISSIGTTRYFSRYFLC